MVTRLPDGAAGPTARVSGPRYGAVPPSPRHRCAAGTGRDHPPCRRETKALTWSWADGHRALAQHLPPAMGQRDVRAAPKAVQRAGVSQTPHPRPVLLRPSLVPLAAVEQYRSPDGRAASQIVRDDPAQMRQQRVTELPAVRGYGAAGERRAGREAFLMVEYGDDGSCWSRPVPGVQSADDLARAAQQRYARSGPFGRFEHSGKAVGGVGGHRSGCGRSESEGHGPPFAYAPTVRAGSGGGARGTALPGRERTVRGASSILAGVSAGGNEQLARLTGISRNDTDIPAQIVDG